MNDSVIRRYVLAALCVLQFDRVIDKLMALRTRVRLARYRRQGAEVRFQGQGGYEIEIAGNLAKFRIHPTSHLKSDTFIECSGGVSIGRYFHPGRGLTIFSTNHNTKSTTLIPYDDADLPRPVTIGDAVWVGANVTIAPGASIGDGAIIGMGSVVRGTVPKCAIVRGNPAQVVGFRDVAVFDALYEQGKFN